MHHTVAVDTVQLRILSLSRNVKPLLLKTTLGNERESSSRDHLSTTMFVLFETKYRPSQIPTIIIVKGGIFSQYVHSRQIRVQAIYYSKRLPPDAFGISSVHSKRPLVVLIWALSPFQP